MTATGDSKVWDLADASAGRSARRHGIDAGGVAAGVLGLIALVAAMTPPLSDEARWGVVGCAGVLAVLVGFSSLRRRQALASLLLALLGLMTPVAAGAVTIDAALRRPETVTSRVVADAALPEPGVALAQSADFGALPAREQSDAASFAMTLVQRLRTIHGDFGPYPASLRLSGGSVVEGAGAYQGTELGVVPDRSRLVYEVARSGDAFRITVVSMVDDAATVTADSSLDAPGS